MRKGQLVNSSPEQPLQMTIVGPTQAGKSSLVNVLLNTGVAGVSPLAGYTVHPQGFCTWRRALLIAAVYNIILAVSNSFIRHVFQEIVMIAIP